MGLCLFMNDSLGTYGQEIICYSLDLLFCFVFFRQSERQVSLFRAKDLHEMTTLSMDVSPTILRPFFDEDSSTLFLTGKVNTMECYTTDLTLSFFVFLLFPFMVAFGSFFVLFALTRTLASPGLRGLQ